MPVFFFLGINVFGNWSLNFSHLFFEYIYIYNFEKHNGHFKDQRGEEVIKDLI